MIELASYCPFKTIAPEATTQLSPMRAPFKIVTLAPIQTLSPIEISSVGKENFNIDKQFKKAKFP